MNKLDKTIVKRVEDSESGNKYILVASETSVYKADVTEPNNPHVNTFLAIRNKTTNELQLIEVQQASFKHTLYDNQTSAYEGNSKIDANKSLHKDFGGKKALASYERAKRTAPNIEILEETLEKQLNTIDSEKFENDAFDMIQEERKKLTEGIFPDIDVSTSGKSVREIFSVKKLLGSEMVDHLADKAVEILQADLKTVSFVNSYLKEAVKSIQNQKQPDSPQNIERVSIFIYLDSLIRLIGQRKKTLDASQLSKISIHVGREVAKKFSMQGNLSNSKFTRQKSIIYYLILILISTDSLSIDLDNVLEGVDLSKTELLKYAAVIGAKLKGNKFYIQSANLDSQSKLSASTSMKGGKRRRT